MNLLSDHSVFRASLEPRVWHVQTSKGPQREELRQMFAQFAATPGLRGPAGPQGPTGPVGQGSGGTIQWKPEKVGFFDPHLPLTSGAGPIVQEGKYVYFVERIKDIILSKGEDVVCTNLNTCLRGSALIWYTGELSELERLALHFQPSL